jgi:hypothetical protein
MTKKQFESKKAEVSDTVLIETIEVKLSKLCATGGKSLSMSVPPQTSDLDMAICELIRRYKKLIITDVEKSLPIQDLPNCTRVEVIDQKGRSYVNWKPTNKVRLSMQDQGRTAKIFID